MALARGLGESVRRFFGAMTPIEAARLLSPVALLTSAIAYAVSYRSDRLRLEDLDGRDPDYGDAVLDLFRWLGRVWFRLELRGIDHVPRGAVLLVGNHNGGVMPLDILFTLAALWDRDGAERAPHVLIHDIIAYHAVGHEFARKLGFLRASPSTAERALRAGRRVAVYPGADVESFRPFWRRGRVELAGHTGFARTAIRCGVPIVPVVSVGTHEQLVVLASGARVARRLRTERWLRTRVVPLVWCVPWGFTVGLFSYVPLPAQTTIAFGAAIRWPELTAADADDPVIVARCAEQVTAAMQALLDRLSAGRIPFLGRAAWARGGP